MKHESQSSFSHAHAHTHEDMRGHREKVNCGNMKQNLADGLPEAFLNDQCKANAKEFWIKAYEQETHKQSLLKQ